MPDLPDSIPAGPLPANPTVHRFIPASQAAAVLQCSLATLKRYVVRGDLKALQRCPRGHWLFDPHEVEAMLRIRGQDGRGRS